MFYIGGTKIGALFGEAVVINNPSITPGFRYMIKQNGGLLAKGRLLGIQFETLFENDLYMQLSRHAVEQARQKVWLLLMLRPQTSNSPYFPTA